MLGNYELKNGTGTIPGSPSSLTAYYNESKQSDFPGFLMTMVMTTIHKSSFEGEVDQWLTMVDRIIVYKVRVPS